MLGEVEAPVAVPEPEDEELAPLLLLELVPDALLEDEDMVDVVVLPRLLVVVTTFPPAKVPLVPEVLFVPEPPRIEVPFVPLVPLVVPLLLLPVAAAAPVVVV